MNRISRLVILAVITFFFGGGVAAGASTVPLEMNYQGFLADPGGNPVNDSLDITFSLYNDSIAGAQVWTETHTGVAVREGSINVGLGTQGAPLNIPFDQPYWLGIQVGADDEMTPRQPLSSVAYALRADKANNADTLDGMDSTAFITDSGGTLTGSLSLPVDGLTIGTDQLTVVEGNIGIGTTSPTVYGQQRVFHLKAAGGKDDAVLILEGSSGSQDGGHIRLGGAANALNSLQYMNEMRIGTVTGIDSGASFSEKLRIDNNGNVGIGTDSPTQKLDVNGQVRIRGGSPAAGKVLTSATDGTATWETPTDNVNDADASSSNELQTLSVSGTDISISSGNTVALAGLFNDSLGNHAATQNISLSENWISGDGESEGLVVDSGGNVGIGTTTTPQRLNVDGSVRVTNGKIVVPDGEAANPVYTFNSNTNAGMFNAGVNQIGFATNGTEVLRIDNESRVGINVANPTAALDVDGQIRIRGGSPAAGKVLTSATDGTATWETPTDNVNDADASSSNELQTLSVSGTDISISSGNTVALAGLFNDSLGNHAATQNISLSGNWISGDGESEGLVVDSGGNVGIGVGTPGAKFHIAGTTDADARAVVESTDNDSNVGIYLKNDAREWLIQVNGWDNDKLVIHDATAGETRLGIDSSGKVGIGTGDPGSELDVVGTVTADYFVGDGSSLFIDPSGHAHAHGDLTDAGTYAHSAIDTHIDDAGIHADGHSLNSANDSETDVLFVDNKGDIGIGTMSPNYPLEIMTASEEGGYSHTDGTVVIESWIGTGGAALHGELGTASNHPLTLTTNAIERMTIDTDGKVGIGIPNPQAMLHVSGATGEGLPGDATLDGILVIGNNGLANDSAGIDVIAGSDGMAFIDFGDYQNGDMGAIGYSNADDSMLFFAFGAERMRIDSAGNIGIGNDSPTEQLHVQGNIRAVGDVCTDDGNCLNSVGTVVGHSLNSANDSVSDALFVANDGSVGVGTTSPVSNLEVVGSGYPSIRVTSTDAQGGGIDLHSSTGYYHMYMVGDQLGFWNGSNDKMVLSADGDVGIGADAPGARLDVKGATNDSLAAALLVTNDAGNSLLYVQNDGNVGIGTTVPAARLEVNSGNFLVTAGDMGMGLDNPSQIIDLSRDDDVAIRFNAEGVEEMTIGVDFNDSGRFKISNSGELGVNDLLTIDPGGNVGIGNDSPTEMLHVQGNIRATGDVCTDEGNCLNSVGVLTNAVSVNDSVGVVSIGTKQPWGLARLAVVGRPAGGPNMTRLAIIDQDNTQYGVLSFAENEDNPQLNAQIAAWGSSSAKPNALEIINYNEGPMILSTNDTSRIFIDAGGDVGIGTMAPDANLHVAGTKENLLILERDTNGIEDVNGIMFRMENSVANDSAVDYAAIYGVIEDNFATSEKGGLAFYTRKGNDSLERMRITGEGRIGVGTAAPLEDFHFNGAAMGNDATPAVEMLISNTASGYAGLSLMNDNTNFWDLIMGGSATGSNAENLQIKYNNAAKLVIASSGKVGIGNDSPTEKLHVQGNIRVVGDVCTDDGNCLNSVSASGHSLNSANDSVTNAVFVDNSGTVGVGTTIPWDFARMSVVGAAGGANMTRLAIIEPAASQYGVLSFAENEASPLLNAQIAAWGSSSTKPNALEIINYNAGPLAFYTNDSERLIIDAGGKVGIGTSNPGNPLEIYRAGGMIPDVRLKTDAGPSYWDIGGDGVGLDLNFVFNDTGKNVIFTATGEVGIGTVVPESSLHVVNTAGNTLILEKDSNLLGDGPGIAFRARNTNDSILGYAGIYGVIEDNFASSEKGALAFFTSKGNDSIERMRITGNGWFGVGTNSPGANFHLNGFAMGNDAVVPAVELLVHNGSDGYANVSLETDGGAYAWDMKVGGTNTGNDSGKLLFKYNSDPKLIIGNSGNVGIGITNPLVKLDVDGDIRVPSGFDVCIDGGGCLSTAAGAGNSLNGVNDSLLDVVYVDSFGNVGIGNTMPDRVLDISSNDNNAVGLRRTNWANDSEFIIAVAGNPGVEATVWQWYNDSTAGTTDLVTFQSSGDVGIGTSAPDARLEVIGQSMSGADFGFNVTDSSSNSLLAVKNDGRIGINKALPETALHVVGNDSAGTTGIVTIENLSGNTLLLGGNHIDSDVNDLLINANVPTDIGMGLGGGSVGIGTQFPNSRLEVKGLTNDSAASGLDVQNNAGNSLLFVRNDGNVGIGTTTPASVLHVGNGPVTYTTVSKASDYTLTDKDDVVFVDPSGADRIITLPAASEATVGRLYRICNAIGGYNVTIAAVGGDSLIGTSTTGAVAGVCVSVIGFTNAKWIGAVGL